MRCVSTYATIVAGILATTPLVSSSQTFRTNRDSAAALVVSLEANVACRETGGDTIARRNSAVIVGAKNGRLYLVTPQDWLRCGDTFPSAIHAYFGGSPDAIVLASILSVDSELGYAVLSAPGLKQMGFDGDALPFDRYNGGRLRTGSPAWFIGSTSTARTVPFGFRGGIVGGSSVSMRFALSDTTGSLRSGAIFDDEYRLSGIITRIGKAGGEALRLEPVLQRLKEDSFPVRLGSEVPAPILTDTLGTYFVEIHTAEEQFKALDEISRDTVTADHHCTFKCRGEPARIPYTIRIQVSEDFTLVNPTLTCLKGACSFSENRGAILLNPQTAVGNLAVWDKPTEWRLKVRRSLRQSKYRTMRAGAGALVIGQTFLVTVPLNGSAIIVTRTPDGGESSFDPAKGYSTSGVRVISTQKSADSVVYKLGVFRTTKAN